MSMTPWKNRTVKDPGFQQKRRIAIDAYYAGCWVYNTETDKWYTPEEFMNSEEQINIHRGKDDAHRFKIRDPKGGIIEKMKRLDNTQKDLSEFVDRVNSYYDLNPIGRKK